MPKVVIIGGILSLEYDHICNSLAVSVAGQPPDITGNVSLNIVDWPEGPKVKGDPVKQIAISIDSGEGTLKVFLGGETKYIEQKIKLAFDPQD